MPETKYRAVVERVEDTEVGRKLQNDPVERERYERIKAQCRAAARPEIEAVERSERNAWKGFPFWPPY